MSIQYVFHCDGPECERKVATKNTRPPTFLTVTEYPDSEFHFCGWDCALRYGATMPPEEVVLADERG